MIRCRILGPTGLSGPDGLALDDVVSQTRRHALLVYLVMQSSRGFIRRDALLPIFWPELDQDRARGALRQALYVLRSSLGDGVLVSRGAEEVGIAPGTLWCDALEFERACDAGQWSTALELYRGDFLESFFIAEAPEFERWMQAHQGRLRLRATSAARALASAQEASGALGDATATIRKALALNGADEESLRHLLALLDAQGDRAAALREYDAFVARLEAEFDASPSAETRAVLERIREREHVRNVGVATPRTVVVQPERGGASAALAEAPAPRRHARGRAWAMTAVALLVIAALSFRAPWTKPPAAEHPDRLVILPFDVKAERASDQAFLREAFVDLLSTGLDGAGDVQTIDPNAVRAALDSSAPPTPAAARLIARQFGARYFVLGRALVAGGRLRVQTTLHDVRSDTAVAQASREGGTETLFDIVDGLATDLLMASQHTFDVPMNRSAALTTQSLPALKAYLEGEQAFQRGDLPRSEEALRQAVGIDSTFALASYRLSVVIDDANSTWIESAEWADRAVRHAKRLSARDQLLLQAHVANLKEDVVASERRYRALLARYPDEVEAWYRLAEVLSHQSLTTGRPPMEARAPLERLLQLVPTHRPALQHLARIAALERRTTELDSLYRRSLALGLAPVSATEMRNLWVFVVGSQAERERTIAELSSAPPGTATGIWATTIYARDVGAARRMTEAMTRPPLSHVRRRVSHRSLARFQAMEGRMESATMHLRDMEQLEPEDALEEKAFLAIMPFRLMSRDSLRALRAQVASWQPTVLPPGTVTNNDIHGPWRRHLRLYLLGHMDVLLGDSASARIEADSLERIARPALPDASEFARELAISVRVHALWRRGNAAAALALLERTRRARPFPYRGAATRAQDVYIRAELLYETGRFADALVWYGAFEYTSAAQLVFASPAHLRRGQINERLGEPRLAAEHYRRFLDLWKDADPVFRPSLMLAEERLRRLQQR